MALNCVSYFVHRAETILKKLILAQEHQIILFSNQLNSRVCTVATQQLGLDGTYLIYFPCKLNYLMKNNILLTTKVCYFYILK